MSNLKVLETLTVVPEENGLINGFRNDGHSFFECVAELIDNSIDAKAKNIKISTTSSQINNKERKQTLTKVVIGDDGSGFVGYKLKEALTIGDRSNFNNKKIGKYGFGLKTSSFSIGQTLQILTKTKAGELESYIWDLSDEKRKSFEVSKVVVTSEGTKIFKDHAGETGTVIVISNVYEEVSRKMIETSGSIRASFIEKMGTVYHRKMINNGIAVFINKKEVKAKPVIKNIESSLIKNKAIACGEGKIKVSFVQLKESENNEEARGVYVYLNDRLLNIKPIQDKVLGFNTSDYNTLRLELDILSWECVKESDGLKINNQKNSIYLSGKIRDEITSLIKSSIKAVDSAKNDSEEEYDPKVVKLPVVKTKTNETVELDSSSLNNSWNTISNTIELKVGTVITADEQKEMLSGEENRTHIKEPRLLNKFDYSNQLPKILLEKNLSPFPIKNGTMVMINKDDAFKEIPSLNKKNIKTIKLSESALTVPKSLTLDDISSEKKAINLCYHYGIFNMAFNERSLVRTVEGMERIEKTTIKIGKENLEIDGVQVETDAGYEGKALHLMEAKIYKASVKDFNIKQLILPHVLYTNKLKKLKIDVCTWIMIWYEEENIVRLIPVDINLATGIHKLNTKEEKAYKLVE